MSLAHNSIEKHRDSMIKLSTIQKLFQNYQDSESKVNSISKCFSSLGIIKHITLFGIELLQPNSKSNALTFRL